MAEAAAVRRSTISACPFSGAKAGDQIEDRSADASDGTTKRRSDPATGHAQTEDTVARWSAGSGAERETVRKFRLTAPEPTENQLHATVAQYLDWALMPPAFYTTFPAGWGVLTKSTAGRLKGAGLKPGVPDILLIYKGRSFWIELKSHTGYLRPSQVAMHEQLRAAGCPVTICTTLDEVIDAVREWGFPLRRTRGASDAQRETA